MQEPGTSSVHFRDNWQGTGLKGQLVCDKKVAAITYKHYLDEIGIVSSEVLISPPDEREERKALMVKTEELVKTFWNKMMDDMGLPKNMKRR